jgi:predicted DNA-binding transcriptional regulator YafY
MTEVLALKPLPGPPSGRDDVVLDTAVLMHMFTDKPVTPVRVPVQKVTVLFREDAARLVRGRMWHPTQEIQEENDGSLAVSLNVPIDPDVISWILGFGSGAFVLEPASLRQRIMDELEATLRRYRTENDTKGKAEKVMPQPRQLQTLDGDEIDLWKLDRK